MSQSMNAEYITWEEIERFTDTIKGYCIPRMFSGVYGIPRGGNVLATMVSYRMGLPLLQAPIFNCLVVDDIADTGDTLLHYKAKGYYIATVCYKKQSKVRPDLYGREIDDDVWVVFPWEGGYDESK